jgi:hypothetical protein
VNVAPERDELLPEVLFDFLLQAFEFLRYVHEVSSLSGFWESLLKPARSAISSQLLVC